MKRRRATTLFVLVGAFALPMGALPVQHAAAQSLEEQLDDEAFLEGLIELELPELLEHYIQTHPTNDPVRATQYRIAGERLRMRTAADPAQREEALRRVLGLRGDLIDRERGHPRRAIWMADQASDLFFRDLPTEAAGMTTLFGVPSDAQRTRAERVAAAMNDLAAQAEVEIEGTIIELEATIGFRDNEALQMQRRRLVRDERSRRIPFLRGVGAFLHGDLGEPNPADRRRLHELAVTVLRPLGEELEGPLAERARLYCGLAAARLGRFEEAEELFARVETGAESYPADVFAAGMGKVLNRRGDRGAASALKQLDRLAARYAESESALDHLLIADQRFLLMRDLARRQPGEARMQTLGAAIGAYLDLLDHPRGVPRETMLAIVYNKLATIRAEDLPLEALPVIVTVAQADRLARDDQSRDEAIELFRSALTRQEIEPRERVAALNGLGRALYSAGRGLEAARCYLQRARDHPTDPEAERAIELATSIAGEVVRSSPAEPGARDTLREALAVLLARFPGLPDIDHWRFVSGRFAMQEQRFDEAIETFSTIAPGATEWLDGRFMQVNAMRAAAAAATDPAERSRRNEEVLERVREAESAIGESMEFADAGRRTDLEYYRASLRVLAADALLDMARPDRALETLSRIESMPGLNEAVLAAALRVRINAYQALDEPEDARREIERFVQAAPDEAGRVIGSILASMLAEAERMLESGREADVREMAERDMVPLATLLEDWIRGARLERAERAALLQRTADVYRFAGRYRDGLRLCDELVRERPDAIEVLFCRAECLFGLGGEDNADAMGLYRRIAAGGIDIGHDYYWQSQVRMLEILDRVQKNVDRIVPRIDRLRLQDSELGGERFRRAFQRLQNKYA